VATLSLVDVVKTYGTVRALDHLHLTIESGELVSLLGPSGCGKTTALRSVAGFERPDSGQVLLDKRDLTSVAANKRDMGMVFQAYSLFPNMTAAENIAFGLKLRKRSSAERNTRADDLLALVGLEGRADRYPHQLSGGQQQRVALARALAIEPSVLLLDEPLSALDAQVRVQLREEIRRLQREVGITTLFVTHDQEEALSISDRVGVMKDGQLEQLASPQALYRHPATEFVASFVGTINRLAVIVRDTTTVTYNGVSLPCSPTTLAVGSHGVLLLRPEVLSVVPRLDDDAVTGAVSGTVRAHSFLGPVARIEVMTDGGHLLLCDLASRDADDLHPGRKVWLRADAKDATVVA
jgi:putative spermidine/putrescine transport system ATP-binding protein